MSIFKKMKSESGFGLIEFIVVIALISIASASVIPSIMRSNETSHTMNIETDRELLKTKGSIYYIDSGDHPLRPTKLTQLMDKDTDGFVRWLAGALGLPPDTQTTFDEIDKRYGWLSSEKLLDKGLIDSLPADDRYVLDTQTYTVYHVTDNSTTRDLLFSESGADNSTLDNMSTRMFPIQTSTVKMIKVNSTVIVGNTIYAGGEGTMQLAKIEVTAQTQKVTDISNKLPNVKEVIGVSSIGSGLRVEYVDTSNVIKIVKVGL